MLIADRRLETRPASPPRGPAHSKANPVPISSRSHHDRLGDASWTAGLGALDELLELLARLEIRDHLLGDGDSRTRPRIASHPCSTLLDTE